MRSVESCLRIVAAYSPPSSTSQSSRFRQTHRLPAPQDHFSFPADSVSESPPLDWAACGLRFNTQHLSDCLLLVEADGQSDDALAALRTAGYRLRLSVRQTRRRAGAAQAGGDGGLQQLRLVLRCHRVVLTTASALLRSIIHDGSGCGAPGSYAATRLLLSGCLSVAALLSLLRCLYSAQAVQELAVDGIVQTMAIARQLQAFSLLPACEAQAARLLSARSLLPLWSSARLLHEGYVVNCCTDFIVTRMEELLHSEQLALFPPFLLQVIGMLLVNSDRITQDAQHRQRLIALFQSRLEREAQREQQSRPCSPPCRPPSCCCPATQADEEATLTAMIRRQRAQPVFDALTSLCSLFFSPTAADVTGGAATVAAAAAATTAAASAAGSGDGVRFAFHAAPELQPRCDAEEEEEEEGEASGFGCDGADGAAAAASTCSTFSCWPLSSPLPCSNGSSKTCELPDCASLLPAAAVVGSRKGRQERRRRSDDQSAAEAAAASSRSSQSSGSRRGRRPSAPCACDVTGLSQRSSENAEM